MSTSASINISNFKEIPGFPGYMLSQSNEVWSFHLKKPRKLKYTTRRDKLGLPHTYLMPAGSIIHTCLPVYLIILLAHKGPAPFEKAFPVHIDGNKANNNPNNLKWHQVL
jgi:hypothetical protein